MRRFREGQWVMQSRRYGSARYGVVDDVYGPVGVRIGDGFWGWSKVEVLWNDERYAEVVFSDEIRPVVVKR